MTDPSQDRETVRLDDGTDLDTSRTAAIDVHLVARQAFDDAAEMMRSALADHAGIDPHVSLRTERSGDLGPASIVGLPSYHVVAVDAAEALADDGQGTLILHGTIGTGGMGTVDAATQRSLGREVAVKRAHDKRPDLAASLVIKATITGQLQHPNVVPVYDLARGGDGRPVLVMKRVEGRTWRSDLRERPDDKGPDFEHWLHGQLRVLMQVSNAVHFAHSRGFVHRDLKPENVMLGGFGEVYVVDWGLALRVRTDAGSRIHRQGDPRRVEGTLAYLAPDQIGATGEGITERTDVFLLGACLHHLLTGKPPHVGRDMDTVVASITNQQPRSYGPTVPAELGAIAAKALAALPAER